jgi:hypothetical protein
MHKPFTLEDLATYSFEVYLETHRSVKKAMQQTGPSNLVMRNILQYSKALRVSHTGSGGPLFLVMN